MLKRFFLAFIVSWLLSPLPAYAAGTIPLSMTQQLDQYGVPLSGCKLYTIQAGTTSTPQNAFKDTALSLVQPNPMVCDASGRLPQFFLADGQIKIRLEDKLGNPQVVLDNILVIGPSSGGGSGATIDPTTIASTGDIKQSYGTQTIAGWVRFNGRTIGNATSGATERANADTQALFLYLWAADANLTVSGGRTSAAADYAANKTIALPDGRGKVLTALDDMGNTAAGAFAGVSFTSGNATTLGSSLGAATHVLAVANLPPHTHSGNTGTESVFHTHTITAPTSMVTGAVVNGGASLFFWTGTGSTNTGNNNPLHTHPFITDNGLGTSTPLPTIQSTLLVTIYIKL